ncbi:MAG TPA: hypothetical protein VFO93_19360 [Hymenobacter sp.]|uniref:hypothetical protein n=1 Tax=Hymenobacter sp. TaxID=1898978 RepID=UPI002D7EBF36|nr:hypothetical protein [Hymenobacter sp.]HET9505712.1 hypothetical protein [Hymenobacter sp.]
MKSLLLYALISCATVAHAQRPQAAPRPDSVRVALHFGSDNAELHQLMARALHVEKWHIEAINPQLAGRRFHLTYQEYRHGVAAPEQKLAGDAQRLLTFDPQGRFSFDVFARQATENRLENQFLFTGGSTLKTFEAQPGKGNLYSLRPDIWPYRPRQSAVALGPAQQPTTERSFAVGQKVPFLVYTLPYEEDGWLLYCKLAQSKTPVQDWYKTFKIPHFVVYNLVVE